jgi:hypothetical protein
VNKLCIFAGTTVCSYAAWFLSSNMGFGAQFIFSGIGSLVGVYLGWKLARKIEG